MAAQTIYPNSHVGFDSITSQIERKLLKRGFQFNVICVGMSFPFHFSISQYSYSTKYRAVFVITDVSRGIL